MLQYALTLGVLFLGCLGASELGLQILGVSLFPFAIAGCIARGQQRRALGLLICAALALWAGGTLFPELMLYMMLAGVGIPLGLGVVHRWSYGWTVTAVTAMIFIAFASAFILTWSDWMEQSQAMWEMWAAQLKKNATEANSDAVNGSIELLRWMKDHWAALGLGAWMWPSVVAGSIAVSAVSSRFRRRWQIEAFRGSFREMRTSEWLIWAAIATALLCFADYRWPEWNLRLLAWNSALALAAIYWLNGLSVFAFAVGLLRPNMLLLASVVFLFVCAQASHPVLCAIGMFDTWADFRGGLRRFAEARKQREGPDDVQ